MNHRYRLPPSRCRSLSWLTVAACGIMLLAGTRVGAETSPAPFRMVTDLQSSFDPCTSLDLRLTEYIFVERLHHPYQCESLPWIRAQLLVKSGERDGMVTIPTEERSQYADVSSLAIATMKMRMFVRRSSAHREHYLTVKKLDDLVGGTFIAQAGSGWAKREIQSRKIPIEWTKSIEGVFRMLQNSRGDFTVQGDIYAIPVLKAMKLENAIEVMPVILGRAEYRLMVSKLTQQDDILRRFDTELKTMTSDGSLAKLTSQFEQDLQTQVVSQPPVSTPAKP